jgi:hypothetical protein
MKLAEYCAGALVTVLSALFLLVGAFIALFDVERYLQVRRM